MRLFALDSFALGRFYNFRFLSRIFPRHQAGEMVDEGSRRRVLEEKRRRKLDAELLAQLSHQLCGRQRIEPHLHERSLEVHGLVCVAVKQRLDAFNDLRSDQGLDLLEVLTCIL